MLYQEFIKKNPEMAWQYAPRDVTWAALGYFSQVDAKNRQIEDPCRRLGPLCPGPLWPNGVPEGYRPSMFLQAHMEDVQGVTHAASPYSRAGEWRHVYWGALVDVYNWEIATQVWENLIPFYQNTDDPLLFAGPADEIGREVMAAVRIQQAQERSGLKLIGNVAPNKDELPGGIIALNLSVKSPSFFGLVGSALWFLTPEGEAWRPVVALSNNMLQALRHVKAAAPRYLNIIRMQAFMCLYAYGLCGCKEIVWQEEKLTRQQRRALERQASKETTDTEVARGAAEQPMLRMTMPHLNEPVLGKVFGTEFVPDKPKSGLILPS